MLNYIIHITPMREREKGDFCVLYLYFRLHFYYYENAAPIYCELCSYVGAAFIEVISARLGQANRSHIEMRDP